MLRFSQKIEVEEGDDDSHKPCHQDTVGRHFLLEEAILEACQCDERQATRQSVDAVDEVNGIADKHHDKHRQRGSYGVWYLVNAHEAIEVVDVETRHCEDNRGNSLRCKLRLCPQTHHVIDKSCAIDNQQAEEKSHRPRAEHDLLAKELHVEEQQHDDRSQQHAGQETESTQSWNGILVNLPAVRFVVKSFFLTEVQDERYEDKATTHAQDERPYDVEYILCHAMFFSLTL